MQRPKKLHLLTAHCSWCKCMQLHDKTSCKQKCETSCWLQWVLHLPFFANVSLWCFPQSLSRSLKVERPPVDPKVRKVQANRVKSKHLETQVACACQCPVFWRSDVSPSHCQSPPRNDLSVASAWIHLRSKTSRAGKLLQITRKVNSWSHCCPLLFLYGT